MEMLNSAPVSTNAHFGETLESRVREFVHQRIIPNEARLYGNDANALLLHLTNQARKSGVWCTYLPGELGGHNLSLTDYLPVAEQQGRSEFGPMILGSDTTLDIRFLWKYASASHRDTVVPQLLAGATAAFAATEPEVPGSLPGRIQTQARWCGDHWSLSGRKWFTSRASDARYFIVLAKVDGAEVESSAVFLVPADAPGVQRVGRQRLLGRDYGQCELAFDHVELEAEARLGQPGQTSDLLEQRLLVGRTLRSMQWVGLAQRCLELMVARMNSERARLSGLAEKQMLRACLFEVHQSVSAARLLVQDAARRVQEGEGAAFAVNTAKVSATRALSTAADTAVQIWGAEGLLDEHPLSGIYRYARATRMMDGPDEALISSVGRHLLRCLRESENA